MRKLKVAFTDFWSGFNQNQNIFLSTLRFKYDVTLVTKDPDLLIFSAFGNDHFNFKCPRVFYTGENLNPYSYVCDGSLSFLPTDLLKQNIRFPIFLLYDDTSKLNVKPPSDESLLNREFCNFIYSNPRGVERNSFYKILNAKKMVSSAGKLFNNIGHPIEDKRKYISGFKFTIAFENESHPGYTTEKLFEPLLEHSLPIYWGNPVAWTDFDKKSFISAHDFKSLEELSEYVLYLDRTPEKYLEYFRYDNKRSLLSTDDYCSSFLTMIDTVLQKDTFQSLKKDLTQAAKRKLFNSHRAFSRF